MIRYSLLQPGDQYDPVTASRMDFESISSKWLTRLESSRFEAFFLSLLLSHKYHFQITIRFELLNSEWPQEILKFDLNFIFGQA